ncbi:uncharacterized protein LOC109489917 isoform X2 [Ailuropoda melanoleuca]|uniref:uncharacterized protein LOC109489917 isoform X2 n=1 Tax=Ailuropoda melanoleuca TaxID=9646 RepID=UPI001494996A|nr:uncharacterized protein LOC109489917 isoform X2 [Ailuropoda melanoleuca]XP_034521621.1 uncharacterized protein LOC109489917 isoform X2 [Ailuropoda melanoleuca]
MQGPYPLATSSTLTLGRCCLRLEIWGTIYRELPWCPPPTSVLVASRTSEAAILPYVPYPTCLATGSPPATHLPVLQPRRTSQLGALMTDPATGIEVPVLAVTLHPQTRQWLTLGGTYCNPLTKTLAPLELGGPMEDPVTGSISPILGVGLDENTGLVPISTGAQAIDPLTGEPGPVIGAQTDPCTGVVVPIVRVLEALPRGVRDPGLLDILEKELKAREQYWHSQGQEELRLAECLGQLGHELLSIPGKDAQQQLRAAEEARAALESCCLQETERRASALSTQSSPEQGLLSQADREEWEQEAEMMLGMQKVLQSLGQTAEKLRQAVGRLQGQEQEMWLEQPRSLSPQIWNRPRKVVEHLSDEFQEVVRERQNFLNRALSHLQYQRELSRLHLLHTQIVASGSPACLENYPGDRFYGMITTSLRDQAAACPLLIPFLKSLTAALNGAQGHGPGVEDQGPKTDADKVDVMWLSPLFSTLKKIDIWSQAPKEEAELQGQMHHQLVPKSSLQDVPKPQIMKNEELITVQPTDLSAREFVVYQYGLSILHLLIPQLHAPEITLQIASRLPVMDAADNAFQGSFFYQSAENTLFVGRESLASVGSFILLLIR